MKTTEIKTFTLKTSKAVVEAERLNTGWHYLGIAPRGTEIHWVTGKGRLLCNSRLRHGGAFNVEATQPERAGASLGTLVTCKHCKGSK